MQPDQMTVVLTGACGGIGQLLARKAGSVRGEPFPVWS